MPTEEKVPWHVFVGGPLHGECWQMNELMHLGRRIDDYAWHWREVVTGSETNRRAFVWRYLHGA